MDAGDALAPWVLIVPGSGPTDRNGNSPLGVRADSYRLIARALAAAGVSSLRFDKRGLFASSAAIDDPDAVRLRDYADDVRGWKAWAGRQGLKGPGFLVGHSEGGLVALKAIVGDPSGFSGLVLIAVPGRPFGALLRRQLEANPANAGLLADADKIIAALSKGERVPNEEIATPLQPLFRADVQDFLIDLMTFDPRDAMGRVSLPSFILQGDADLQIGSADAGRLKAANAGARLAILTNVNHVLKAVPEGDRAANLAAYGDPSLPVAETAMAEILGFIDVVSARHANR